MPEFNTWFPDTHLPSEGFRIQGTNIDCVGDPSHHSVAQFKVTQEGNVTDPGYTTSTVLHMDVTSNAVGHNNYRPGIYSPGLVEGSYTAGKHTWTALSVYATHRGAGQRILTGYGQLSYGMGDSAVTGWTNKYWGGPVAGDEGQGLALVSYLTQGDTLQLTTITGPTIRSALDTTTTQVIVASNTPQAVTVASTTGAVVGDWVVVEQEQAAGEAVLEAVKITAIGSGTITGVFLNSHPTGVKVRPATCLTTDAAHGFGQQRVLVNMSGASYATGTIDSASGGSLVGVGTAWSNTMVGGDAENVGAIAITTDTYNGEPFHGVDGTAFGPLRSWHQIIAITDPTHLGFHTYSCAGDIGYKGRDDFPSAYTIRPAMRMLVFDDGMAICEYSAHAWDEGDLVECALCPYPDVSGFQFNVAQYTPNGQNSRSFLSCANTGARRFQQGIQLTGFMRATSVDPGLNTADTIAWDTGIHMSGCNTGIRIVFAGGQTDMTCAIDLPTIFNGSVSDNGSKITFGGVGHIVANSTNIGLDIYGAAVSSGGHLTFISDHLTGDVLTDAAAAARPRMDWDGSLRVHGWLDLENLDLVVDKAPPAGVTNQARIYCDTSGGKQRLMVVFDTGTAVQIAIEP